MPIEETKGQATAMLRMVMPEMGKPDKIISPGERQTLLVELCLRDT
jgi:hypothetical protein